MDYELVIFCSLLFVWLLTAWEAMFELSRGRIRRLENGNRTLAKKLEIWLEQQEELDVVFRFLTFFMTAFLAFSLHRLISSNYPHLNQTSVYLHALLMLFAVLIILGTISRMLILRFDLQFMQITMPLIMLLRCTIFRPILMLVRFSEFSARGLGNNESSDDNKTTAEDEIMSLVEGGNDENGENSLEDDEKRMIRGIFDLDDTPVREIMTPRVDMTSITFDSNIDKAKKCFIESGHSRIPVYGTNIDEIKGVIYAKDFLDETRETDTLEDYLHFPLFIPETKNVGDLLEEFKTSKIHVAIIIDEYGGTSGIVTLEDILEEIVGEIRDEYDNDEDEDIEPHQAQDGSIVVDGRMLISDINNEFELEIPEKDDIDTIGGFVCAELGKIPASGETITLDNVASFEVLKADSRKILSLKITRISE